MLLFTCVQILIIINIIFKNIYFRRVPQVGAVWDFLLAELEEPLPLDGKTLAAVDLNDQAELPEGLAAGYAGYGAEHHGVRTNFKILYTNLF